MKIDIRYARRDELERINELRCMVSELHASGRPDIFRHGFCAELRDYIYTVFESDRADVVAALIDGEICGFAIVEYIDKPESPYMNRRRFMHISEFGVDEKYRRLGAASAMIDFCRAVAREKQFGRIELDVWEFNGSAELFYEREGFTTYRRYMELDVPDGKDQKGY